ncbi:hypothetical protein ABKA04_006783 [Annulohypoxylon sp. FPYF3050]
MGSSYTRNLKKIAISFFLVSSALSFVSASPSASSPPSESPSAETELICHTDNPADCYPKVFSATEEFQVVHDDQDLPPGLHVQLDVQTGKKQAKLCDPKEKANPALKGLPVDRSIIIVDPDSSPSDDDTPRIPPGAPAYDPVGKAKPPRTDDELFTYSLDKVKKHAKQYADSGDYSERSIYLEAALENLSELAHDMYYGLQIASDADAVHGLFCLATYVDGAKSVKAVDYIERPDFLSAATLGNSLANNWPAKQALENSWDAIMARKCASASTSAPAHYFFANLSPTSKPGSVEESDEVYNTLLSLFILGPAIKSPKIKEQFLEAGGMTHLLEILLRDETVWQRERRSVARIVSDTFLDADFGAVLGVWPTSAKATEDSVCAKGGRESRGDGCWEYHLEKFAREPSNEEWSQPLLDLLKKRRAEIPASRRDEL